MNIYRRLMKLTSPDGDLDVPGDGLRLEFGPDDGGHPMNVVITNEGGSSMWIAYRHGAWQFHTDTKYAYQLARWIIWDWWVKATWCGIRRKIYFWALKHDIDTWRANA